MEKLIEILNEYEKSKDFRDYEWRIEKKSKERMCWTEIMWMSWEQFTWAYINDEEMERIIISKKYEFIKWLVENDKIDRDKKLKENSKWYDVNYYINDDSIRTSLDWTNITRDKAKSISEELYEKAKGDSVNSKLCSSYAWDTALKFIENKFSTYPTNSTQGNYSDKSAELGKPARTGQTTAVNNIFDMGGNTWEWTTEAYREESNPCTKRGGGYGNSSSDHPAASRTCSSRNYANDGLSFRTTLYL